MRKTSLTSVVLAAAFLAPALASAQAPTETPPASPPAATAPVTPAAPPASTTAAPSEEARFTFSRVNDGYLRLDGRTGQVSLCSRRTAGWACEAVPDERIALEQEIGRLQESNALLKKELLANNLKLPGNVRPDAPRDSAAKETPGLKLPGDAELDRVMAFIEKVWRRMIAIAQDVQKDFQKKS